MIKKAPVEAFINTGCAVTVDVALSTDHAPLAKAAGLAKVLMCMTQQRMPGATEFGRVLS